MARVPAGEFTPPFRDDTTGAVRVRIGAFWLDKRAVSTAEYLAFVRDTPRYARSRVNPLFADKGYLRAWEADGRPPARSLDSPVTSVSWHAAKQYCADRGKRLPTTAEWELAAAAISPGTDSAARERAILEWYSRSAAEEPPASGTGTRHAHGIAGLHGVIWEWTADFNAWNGGGVNARGVKGEGLFCGGGGARALPNTSYATYMRWAFRASLRPDYTVATLGFRCARDETPSGE
jgi:formylglycine-generating enzyme required for sulfatase activity